MIGEEEFRLFMQEVREMRRELADARKENALITEALNNCADAIEASQQAALGTNLGQIVQGVQGMIQGKQAKPHAPRPRRR